MTQPTVVTQVLVSPDQLEEMLTRIVKKVVSKEIKNLKEPRYGEYVDRKEAAQILKCSKQTVASYDKAKKIIRAPIPGKTVRYALKEIMRYAVVKGITANN